MRKRIVFSYILFFYLIVRTLNSIFYYYDNNDFRVLSMFFLIFLITPIIFWSFFWYSTQDVRNIDFCNIDKEEFEKLFESIKKSKKNYISRVPYLFYGDFFLKSFVIHFIFIWTFFFFGLALTSKSLLGSMWDIVIFISCTYSYFVLVYDELEKNFSDIKFPKSWKQMFHDYFSFFKYLILEDSYLWKIHYFFLILISIILVSVGIDMGEIFNRIGNIPIIQFISPNPLLIEKHLDLAQISFLLFGGSLIIIGILHKYFEIKRDVENAFEEVKMNLKSRYKQYLTNVFDYKNFLFYLLDKGEDFLIKTESSKSKIGYVLTEKMLIRRTALCGYNYVILGVFFLIYSIITNYLRVSETYFTFDMILLVIFVGVILYHGLGLAPLFKKRI